MDVSEHLGNKIRTQFELIRRELSLLKNDERRIILLLVQDVFNQSRLIRVPEKDIALNYSGVPDEIKQAIIESKLERKIHLFYNLNFSGDPIISRIFTDYMEAIYRVINYIINLIVYAHPGHNIGDKIKSILKNSSSLHGNIARIVENNRTWIDEFKKKRAICTHKSPFDYSIQFQVRENDSTIHYILKNNHNDEQIDLFEIFSVVPKLEMFSRDIKQEIQTYLELFEK